jgi:transposase
MKGDRLVVSQRELQRWQLMGLVEVGKITLGEAADKMGVSYRHAKRIRARVKGEGIKGVVHRNRGRPSPRRTSEEIRETVLDLSRGPYEAFNDSHFTEQLAEHYGIQMSRETVRRFRRAAGIAAKRKHKPRWHRKRRQRMAQEGLMVLWDGSPHRWFGPEHPPCCLLAAMDDATGKVLAARFFPFEGSGGYLWLLDRMVTDYGIPLSIYQDRHGALHRNDPHWSLEEQLAGRQEPTQVGVALEALGIGPIFALSPQAKGRIERLFGTLQDRLMAELKLAGISTIETANEFLHQSFIADFNQRFGVAATDTQKAWRRVPKGLDRDRIISFRYRATVGNDNTVKLGGIVIDIPEDPHRRSYAKAKVEVRQLLDGSWRVYCGDNLIATHDCTALQEPLRALQRKKYHTKGAQSYCWVYLASAPNGYGEHLISTMR